MDRRTQTPQDLDRRDPPIDGGPDPHSRQTPETQSRPSLNVGPAFARTVRHFFPDFNDWLDEGPDRRCQERIPYHPPFLLWLGSLFFVGKPGSRRQLDFKYREGGTCVLNNLNGL